MKITNLTPGAKVFVGIDVHKRTYAVCCISGGEIIHRYSTKAEPQEFSAALKKQFGGQEIFSVYEAGFSGLVLHRALSAAGIINIVVNPASIERASNDKVKTDKIDSAKLAKQLMMGNLKPNYIPSEEEELFRQLHRTREHLVEDRVAVGNRIKSKLMLFGFVAHDNAEKMSGAYLKKIEKLLLPEPLRLVIDVLIEEWRHLKKLILKLERQMSLQNLDKKKLNTVIRSVPGIGIVSANTLLTELGDMSRFRNERQLSCFTGVPSTAICD